MYVPAVCIFFLQQFNVALARAPQELERTHQSTSMRMPLSTVFRSLTPLQLVYFASAAEALSSAQGEIEELSVAAEGEYRYHIFSSSSANVTVSQTL